LKELIIRSGFNVFPAEVEAALNAHPDVTQSAVVGRDTGTDEEVVAFVELVPGAKVTPGELLEYASASLAPYKRPSEIIVMASMPAAASGKILKGRLKEMARERYLTS
jgi:acyl-CoA synthetase (AMP-forming)/AMP-acid ligase II